MDRGLKEAAEICSNLVQMQEPQDSLDFIIEQFRGFVDVSVEKVSFSREHPNVIMTIQKNRKKKVMMSAHVDVGEIGASEDWRFDQWVFLLVWLRCGLHCWCCLL